ncbi:MAG: hypothetical protein M1832_000618 [Thelocarpon impressellum]|nr:MAG: hypothetical protein M1832_000618 [Thelocarpon impressellum]
MLRPMLKPPGLGTAPRPASTLLRLPPTFLLPSRGRSFNSTAPIVEASESAPPPGNPPPPTSAPPSTSTPDLHASVKTLLPLLRAQQAHYITAHIHARPYLLTTGDSLRLPFLMPGVVPGDILRLTCASTLGSRDYTLRGEPYLDTRMFECRARVMGVEAEPMRVKEKTKRRNRKVKAVKSKHRYTVLKVAEIKVRSLEDIEGEGAVEVRPEQ